MSEKETNGYRKVTTDEMIDELIRRNQGDVRSVIAYLLGYCGSLESDLAKVRRVGSWLDFNDGLIVSIERAVHEQNGKKGGVMKGKGRIKKGAMVGQDHSFMRWPILRKDADPDTIFDVEWNGKQWVCRADGYGYLRSNGDKGEYGNGAVYVFAFDNVKLLKDEASTTPEQILARLNELRDEAEKKYQQLVSPYRHGVCIALDNAVSEIEKMIRGEE